MSESSSTVPLDPREAAAHGLIVSVHAANTPDRCAIRAPAGDRSFGELDMAANQLARALRARGLGSHDSVGLVCSNRPEFAETWAATQRSGFGLTPINWHLKADEIVYILEDSGARALIGDARFGDELAEAARRVPGLAARLAVGGEIEGFEGYDAALADHSSAGLDDAEIGIVMFYTSGTTGRPKGVRRGAWGPPKPGPSAKRIRASVGYDGERDTHLCTGPLYHAAPFAFSLAGPVSVGVGVVLMDGWDAAQTLDLIEEHAISHSHMVPTMFHRMLALPDEIRRGRRLDSLRMVLHGAAPCPVPVKRALIEWLGPIVYEYYAATEGFGAFVDSAEWLERPGTVGRPAEDHVRILDDAGRRQPTGEVGCIFLRAPDDDRFYYQGDEAKTRGAYDQNGRYFTLGDIGRLDDDGYLYLEGRSAEVIISAGVNIYPAEVDAVLLEHPQVADVATIGVPDDDWGESVHAVIELRPGDVGSAGLERALIEFCRERLAHYKCPKAVDFSEALPRHDTGKIYRRLVREPYWQGRDRQI